MPTNSIRIHAVKLSTNFSKALSPAIVKSEGAGNRKSMYNISFIGCKLSFYLLFICQLPIMLDTNFILSTHWKIKYDRMVSNQTDEVIPE